MQQMRGSFPPIQSLASIEALKAPWPEYANDNSFFWSKLKRYAYTKVLNEIFKGELQRRLEGSAPNIVCLSAHAGLTLTPAVVQLPYAFQFLTRILGSTPAGGATSTIFATTATEMKQHRDEYKGAWIDPKAKLGPPIPESGYERLGSELWSTTDKIVKDLM